MVGAEGAGRFRRLHLQGKSRHIPHRPHRDRGVGQRYLAIAEHADGIRAQSEAGKQVLVTDLPREYGDQLLCNAERQIIAGRPRCHDQNLLYIFDYCLLTFLDVYVIMIIRF